MLIWSLCFLLYFNFLIAFFVSWFLLLLVNIDPVKLVIFRSHIVIVVYELWCLWISHFQQPSHLLHNFDCYELWKYLFRVEVRRRACPLSTKLIIHLCIEWICIPKHSLHSMPICSLSRIIHKYIYIYLLFIQYTAFRTSFGYRILINHPHLIVSNWMEFAFLP